MNNNYNVQLLVKNFSNHNILATPIESVTYGISFSNTSAPYPQPFIPS